jgi:hypothetical protein
MSSTLGPGAVFLFAFFLSFVAALFAAMAAFFTASTFFLISAIFTFFVKSISPSSSLSDSYIPNINKQQRKMHEC